MGTSSHVTCPKCKKNYYCGYGSYTSHEYRIDPVMKEHEGHGAVSWQPEWAWIKGDDLVEMTLYGYRVWIPGAGKFDEVDREVIDIIEGHENED